jgi:hypothetical protein
MVRRHPAYNLRPSGPEFLLEREVCLLLQT